MLSTEQKAHYQTFGFVALRRLFTPEEMSVIKLEADEIFEEDRAGQPAGEETQGVAPFFERRPFMSTQVDDDRIHDIGVDLCGPDFILEVTEGNLHFGDTPWHAATEDEDPETHPKIAFYPEAVTRETGCLRVVPGSHRRGTPDLLAPLRDGNRDPEFRPFGMAPSEIPSYPFESQPGDVIVFTEHLLHASFGGHDGRHQHAVSFMPNPKTDAEVAGMRRLYEVYKYGLRPAESYVNSDRPRIRRMVSRLVEWGFDTWKL